MDKERTMEILVNALEDIYHRLGWEAKIVVEGDQIVGVISGDASFMVEFSEGDEDDETTFN
jgi:hypothetical protein